MDAEGFLLADARPGVSGLGGGLAKRPEFEHSGCPTKNPPISPDPRVWGGFQHGSLQEFEV